MSFDIEDIVQDVGEQFTLSSVASTTTNEYGDNTYTFNEYIVSGVVQVMAGDEEEVKEGILSNEDIIVYVDEDTGFVNLIDKEDMLTVVTTVSGIFRIVGVIHNAGHYEIQAKRVAPL